MPKPQITAINQYRSSNRHDRGAISLAILQARHKRAVSHIARIMDALDQ